MIPTRSPALVLAVMAGCLTLAACSDPPRASNPTTVTSWPAFDENMHSLFNDVIHPSAVGLSLDGGNPAQDPLLGARVLAADLVARVKVSTVTRDKVGAKVTYYLNLQVGRPPLVDPKWDVSSIELAIHRSTGAFGIVHSLDNTMQGRTFIAFVRRFASSDPGEAGPQLHWHLTADTPDVAQAIAETSALGEISE